MSKPDPRGGLIGFAKPDDYRRMRDVLSAANYTDQGVLQTTGSPATTSRTEKDVPALLRRTADDTPLALLIRLFFIGVPLELRQAQAAAAPMPLETWIKAGLVAIEHDQAKALVQLVPFCGRWLIFDRPMVIRGGQARADYVMGVGTSTMTLANITIRRTVDKTLDLGCGCGTHAFLAADHSKQVFAVDRNPRAVAFTAFGAKLNGLPDVQCVTGDLFDPVANHRFGLVVSNPPFVISPSQRYIYRDAGCRGDAFCQKLVRQVPAYLEEGGFCQFMCNWVHDGPQAWPQRLARWFSDTGCDAWVMRSETRQVSDYATTWINHTESDGPQGLAQIYDQWMRYYEQEGIGQISSGLITMRKATDRSNWFRADDAPKKMVGPCGPDMALCFVLHDFLETHKNDDDLLATTFRVGASVRLNQQFHPDQGAWAGIEGQLCRLEGLAYSGRVDHYIAGLVARCDGQRSLGQLVQELAQTVNQDLGVIAKQVATMVRTLIDQAFLLPEGVDGR